MKIYDRQCVHTYTVNVYHNVSVEGVVALGGHFATLCQELDFYEDFFFIINFQKEKANTLTLLIIPIVKILQIELRSTNLLHTMIPNLPE